jgi:hypothetical protein
MVDNVLSNMAMDGWLTSQDYEQDLDSDPIKGCEDKMEAHG